MTGGTEELGHVRVSWQPVGGHEAKLRQSRPGRVWNSQAARDGSRTAGKVTVRVRAQGNEAEGRPSPRLAAGCGPGGPGKNG